MQAQAELEVDYLVVGAGAAGMAFTDRLLAGSDATVAIVDRRHAPGGHWIDAYPYVRLHQPSTFYGVDSVPLGADSIDQRGTNAGYYELAGASASAASRARKSRWTTAPSPRTSARSTSTAPRAAWRFACFQFALLGTIETLPLSDDEKNWLCAPIAYWDVDRDYLAAFVATLIGDRMRAANPTLASFAKTSRLNPVSGVAAHRDDPRVIDARERIKRHGAAAVANLQRLLAER